MRSAAAACVVTGVLLAACGAGSPAPSPDPAPQPPSGTTGPGSTSSPSATPTPTPTSTPTPISTPTPTPTPTSTPTSTSTPTPTPTPTVPPACIGLLPADPGPGVAYGRAEGLDPSTCDDPITDGHGDWIGVGTRYHATRYGFVSASSPGEPVGLLGVWFPEDGGSPVAPQPDGYHAVSSQTGAGPFLRFDPRGALLSTDTRFPARAIAGVPGGGSVLVAEDTPSRAYRIVWLGAQGEERAEAAVSASSLKIVVSATGDVLAFAGGRARWYGRDGAPTTDWFSYGPDLAATWYADQRARFALADGSVVVALGTDHALRFEPGAPRAAPPPAWLSSRAGAEIAAVRGNRANAFARVKSDPTSACEVEIELLTPAGEACGAVTLTAPEPCERVSFGADRTVFTTGTRFVGGAGACLWRWWTGLLR